MTQAEEKTGQTLLPDTEVTPSCSLPDYLFPTLSLSLSLFSPFISLSHSRAPSSSHTRTYPPPPSLPPQQLSYPQRMPRPPHFPSPSPPPSVPPPPPPPPPAP